MEKVMVVDADGLFLVTSEPSIVQGYRNVILTPNEAEFGRLYHKVVSQHHQSLQNQDKAGLVACLNLTKYNT